MNLEEKLRNNLLEINKKYAKDIIGKKQVDEVDGSVIRRKIPDILGEVLKKHTSLNYTIKGSNGATNLNEIPWVAIFIDNITKKAEEGIYIVYLFKKDFSGVYLSLNQGITYFNSMHKGKGNANTLRRNEAIKTASLIRNELKDYENFNTTKINLLAQNDLGKGYEAGHIIGKYYDLNQGLEGNNLVEDLKELFKIYEQVNILMGNRKVKEYYDYIVAKGNGLYIDGDEEDIDNPEDDNEDLKDEKCINSENNAKYAEGNYEDKPNLKRKAVRTHSGKEKVPRDKNQQLYALEKAEYYCEYDRNHKSFISKKSQRRYVEAHHLIPMSRYNEPEIEYSIDVPANIISLCPICHKILHHGLDEEKLEILQTLYKDREKRLSNAGILISIDRLQKYYKINNKK